MNAELTQTLTKKVSDFLKPNPERRTYRKEFQTNLNLQARALQRPLGFIAAVAWEIRRLADQPTVSTLEIEQVVKEMQSAVFVGVMEMDRSMTAVRGSAKKER